MTDNNPFLDDDAVEVTKSAYMKFEDGENRFRALAKPVTGYEYWVDSKGEIQDSTMPRTQGETYKPVRVKKGIMMKPDEAGNSKHFWALPVWNYKTARVEVLEITQKTVQKQLAALVYNDEWGSPLNYDVQVIKEGQKLDTKYSVIPTPKKPLTEEQKKAIEETPVNLEALFVGGDPFLPLSEQEKEINEILAK